MLILKMLQESQLSFNMNKIKPVEPESIERCGVAIIHDLSELPSCHTWKNIPNTNDYENEYGWMAELAVENYEKRNF